MDDHTFEPRTISQVFGDRDQTQPSTWSSKPSETSRPRPSAKIRGLIGRLGLRYHPSNAADLSSHQAMLGLLAEDLSHVDPNALAIAIDRHVAMSPYMPKAADLIKLAQAATMPHTSSDEYAESLNGMGFTKTMGWHWFVRTHPDGRRELDRRDAQDVQVSNPWKPQPGEAQATQEVVAKLIAQGTDQYLFDQMVRRGSVSHMVDERLREMRGEGE